VAAEASPAVDAAAAVEAVVPASVVNLAGKHRPQP